ARSLDLGMRFLGEPIGICDMAKQIQITTCKWIEFRERRLVLGISFGPKIDRLASNYNDLASGLRINELQKRITFGHRELVVPCHSNMRVNRLTSRNAITSRVCDARVSRLELMLGRTMLGKQACVFAAFANLSINESPKVHFYDICSPH